MNKLVIGNVVIDDVDYDNLMSGSLSISNSLSADELTIDTLDAEADFSVEEPTIFQPSDADGLLTSEDELFGVLPLVRVLTTSPSDFSYGQEVLYYRDIDGVETLYAKFYMSTITRQSKYIYAISCVSAIGLLDGSNHYGGVYDGATSASLIKDIIGGVVSYTLDSAYSKIKVYGWLPIDTRRNNLHQVLFALGLSVFKDSNRDMYITAMSGGDAKTLDDESVYLDGGSVDYLDKANKAVVVEHSYFYSDAVDEETLYDGLVASSTIQTPAGSTVDGALIQFNKPIYPDSLRVEGATILESNPNYAVLAPSAECGLYGKPYCHTTREIVSRSATGGGSNSGGDSGSGGDLTPETPGGDDDEQGGLFSASVDVTTDKEARVEDATLVSAVNSRNVADRVYAYYSAATTVNVGIVVDGEKPGQAVNLTDPYGDSVSGYIKSMDLTMSNVLKADAAVVTGYAPPAAGNNYNQAVILTGATTWTVPSGIYHIRLILVGGGHGGASGAPGEAGASAGKGGAGGKGGEPGSGGKVLIVDLDVTPGQTFSFVPGSGGAGGVCDGVNSVEGKAGTASTFGGYSSDDGSDTELGYQEIFGGSVYALPGQAGRSGGDGRDYDDTSELEPLDPENDRSYPGENGETKTKSGAVAYGGGGGGAAFSETEDRSGYPGEAGNFSVTTSGQIWVNGGSGGQGADGGKAPALMNYEKDDPLTPEPQGAIWTPVGGGYGGYGGHGGGGGGGGGQASGGYTNVAGSGGSGGNGGDGGDGYAGCAILYTL